MSSIGKKLEEQILNFEALNKKLEDTFFIFRRDGIVLYTNNKKDKVNHSSMGALFGGLWQAAETLVQYVPVENQDGFRLSFDSSNSGIFILPIPFAKEPLFLSAIYSSQRNPALIKNNLRTLKNFLMDKESFIVQEETSTDNNLLFGNITDDEMDQLFSFM